MHYVYISVHVDGVKRDREREREKFIMKVKINSHRHTQTHKVSQRKRFKKVNFILKPK